MRQPIEEEEGTTHDTFIDEIHLQHSHLDAIGGERT